jgi:hypothetical protein
MLELNSFLDKLTLVVVFLSLNKASSYYRLHAFFLVYFLINNVVNLLGVVVAKMGHYNLWIYNPYSTIDLLIHFTLFYFLLNSSNFKKIIVAYGIALFAAFWISFFFIFDFYNQFFNYNYIFGLFGILLFCTFYLFENFAASEPVASFSQFPFNWVVSGIFIFAAANILQSTTINYLIKLDMNLANKMFMINHVANLCNFVLVITGFGISLFHQAGIINSKAKQA